MVLLPASSHNTVPYLILYDQTLSNSSYKGGNVKVRLLKNLDDKNLTNATVLDLQLSGDELLALYDIFAYSEGFVITGKFKSNSKDIMMAFCYFDEANTKMVCDGSKAKSTGISEGYVGITRGGRFYYAIDHSGKKLKVYYLQGEFSDSSWNTVQFKEVKDLLLAKSSTGWYTRVHLNQHAATFHYLGTNRAEVAFTMVSLEVTVTASEYKEARFGGVAGRQFMDAQLKNDQFGNQAIYQYWKHNSYGRVQFKQNMHEHRNQETVKITMEDHTIEVSNPTQQFDLDAVHHITKFL